MLVLTSACRVSNPGFGVDDDTGTTRELRSDASATQGDTENTSTAGPSEVKKTSAPGASTSGTTSGSLDPSSTAESTSTETVDPKAQAIAEYCSKGSVACYPMQSVEDGILRDYGPHKRHIKLSNAKTVEATHEVYALDTAVKMPGTSFRSDEEYSVPASGIIGFDVWLRPADVSAIDWRVFALGSNIALERRSTSTAMKCTFNEKLILPRATYAYDPKPGELYHMACALSKEDRIVWVNGWIDSKGTLRPSSTPTKADYVFGDPTGKSSPFNGDVGAIRVWEDVEAMRAEIARLFPEANK